MKLYSGGEDGEKLPTGTLDDRMVLLCKLGRLSLEFGPPADWLLRVLVSPVA